ncbi:hypothetical protein [Microbacterium dextranolyticum]|uniref:Uncharacterized protein n=1 Tax=Microbacterium dextranolyticum TaxID=36806 RepID=A0A9W6M5C3_9MICO|nr:hypothetical protein [Microbacterium dextranolyticum]MBM7463520.1 hypothetical protein [Microbacterium dextranolyticum]GLJ94622.1 hypothetical protein GCM10017591_06830 [Microbacterium dextranolyticum]
MKALGNVIHVGWEATQMAETTAQGSARPVFSLAENSETEPVEVAWAGNYLALGARLARHADSLDRKQLIVVLSVPRRDYVAALVGAGWTLTRPVPTGAGNPLQVARDGGSQAWYRALNASYVYAGELRELNEAVTPARMRYAGSHFKVTSFLRMAPALAVDGERREVRVRPGSIVRYTRAIESWDDRLVAPAQDLALVGIESRLRADLEAVLCRLGDSDGDRLDTLLRPWSREAATWFSRIYSSATLEEAPSGYKAVLLDGQGAIKYIAETFSPVVVCVIDRSVADETQAESLVNMRRTEGTAVDVAELLGWRPLVGIEIMGFEVRL